MFQLRRYIQAGGDCRGAASNITESVNLKWKINVTTRGFERFLMFSFLLTCFKNDFDSTQPFRDFLV